MSNVDRLHAACKLASSLAIIKDNDTFIDPSTLAENYRRVSNLAATKEWGELVESKADELATSIEFLIRKEYIDEAEAAAFDAYPEIIGQVDFFKTQQLNAKAQLGDVLKFIAMVAVAAAAIYYITSSLLR